MTGNSGVIGCYHGVFDCAYQPYIWAPRPWSEGCKFPTPEPFTACNPKLPLSAKGFRCKDWLAGRRSLKRLVCVPDGLIPLSKILRPIAFGSARKFKKRAAFSALGRVVYQSEEINVPVHGHPWAGTFTLAVITHLEMPVSAILFPHFAQFGITTSAVRACGSRGIHRRTCARDRPPRGRPRRSG
jgi:hypothetical protein